MNKEKCFIKLIGCDDSTLIDLELTNDEIKLLEKIATKSDKISTYSCMPVMRVIKGEEAEKLEQELLERAIEEWNY